MTVKPEFTGSVFTSEAPMTPSERLANWQLKQPGPGYWRNYEKRVRALEEEGMTRSDAQAVVDAEDMT